MATYVYLAPHLDDVVLSCGGNVHRQVTAGETVTVVTFFAASPPSTEFSDFARSFHSRWDLEGDPVETRQTEDIAAVSSLGAAWMHLEYLDSIYRRNPITGEWLYTSMDAIFADVHPSEATWPLDLADKVLELFPSLEDTTLYAPLAVGHHVDHQLLHRVGLILARRGHSVAFYEDYPYVEKEGSLEAALSVLPKDTWKPHLIELEESDIEARIAAISHYTSQLKALFGGPERVDPRVRAYASGLGGKTGYAERYWQVADWEATPPAGECEKCSNQG